MQHSINVPPIFGDIVSIFGVAHAKALHFATLGGSSLHEPSYEGRLRVYIRDLVADANAGKLGVCSQHGKIGSVEEVLAEAKEHMVEPLDDPDMTIALNVWVSLRQLNDWAALTGDLFTISHDALWLDERGWMNVHGVPPKLSFKIDLAPDLPQLADPQGQKNAAFVEAESASGGVTTAPLPLTSGDIAFCFAGLRWKTEAAWKKPLGDRPKWLAACIVTPGQRGVRETRWNPVLIGAALVRRGHAKVNNVRAKFQTMSHLEPWLDTWKTYEADNFDKE